MHAAENLSGFAVLEEAAAKINLALAVTGRREDGYHLLDSLVTFTAFGDRIGLSPADEERFTLSGRFSDTLAAEDDNLVIRARDRLRAALKRRFGRDIEIDHSIDADILGGAIIDAGDVVIDGSVRGRLTRLEQALTH